MMTSLVWSACSKEAVHIWVSDSNCERAVYGSEKLKSALNDNAKYSLAASETQAGLRIGVGVCQEEAFGKLLQEKNLLQPSEYPTQKESFRLLCPDGKNLYICGADASGALYGCLEVAERIRKGEKFAAGFDFSDAPKMVLRGTCIGMQKPYYLPGRTVYEYPYTEDIFPWFYDKELWIQYLDMLVEQRMNSIYLWNGHPFASLVKLEDYPYAVEVSDEDFKKNQEMFSFLTEEADKRGIWIIQMFYNIIVSKPFAEHHGIPTQNRQVEITPLLEDYTRKSIAAFIENYPHVGLLVTLGEAMNTVDDDVNWFTNTILPGVKDGLAKLGNDEEPPIVLRAHDTNCKLVMDAALPIYKNLYTMNKYNGESLCTYEPRGPWTETHRSLSALGSVHISNVHILANLEPFRYGSPDFIQKSVQAMHQVHGANGLHLFPQASYWDWPYSADKLADGSRLLEMDRDHVWYEAWGRYSWNDERNREDEIAYWSQVFANQFGCKLSSGADILEAYEQTGEISPKLLRKFGITEGNRETFLLGMFMSQLVNPTRWTVYPAFAESCGPIGEKLEVWAEKEFKGEEHQGETPPVLVEQTREHARKAVEAIEKVKKVRCNQDEFERLKNDVYCYEAFTLSFTDKLEAAMEVLMYKYDNDLSRLEKAVTLMESSLEYYRKLVALTEDHYLYANSMQTGQRRIPASGANGDNKLWSDLLPAYENELANFKLNIETIRQGEMAAQTHIEVLKPAEVTMIVPQNPIWVEIKEGNNLTSAPMGSFGSFGRADRQPNASFQRQGDVIALAEELSQLKALVSSPRNGNANHLEFRCDKPTTLWIGYYNSISPSSRYTPAPKLETDASANIYGQADIKIANALELSGMPAVNVHSYRFEAGEHVLDLGSGSCLILGFSEPVSDFKARDAGLKAKQAIDWLFY